METTNTYRGLLCFGSNCEEDDLIAFVDETTNKVTIFASELEYLSRQVVTLRYYVSDVRQSADELFENFVKTLYGKVEADYGTHYSELTGYLWTDEKLNVGGHDIISELRSHVGKFIHLEIKVGKK